MSTLTITPLSTFGTGQVFWSMLWFFCFFIWIWLLIMVFADIFRSHEMSGWAKALWIVFVVVLPYLGVLVYLIARGKEMTPALASTTPSRWTPPSASTSRAWPAVALPGARRTRSRVWPTSRRRASSTTPSSRPARPRRSAEQLRRAGNGGALMCRWLAYSGAPVNLEELLFKPKNSLVIQSKHSKLGATTTNGDGFGVGWYGVGETAGDLPQHRAGLERPQPARAVGPRVLAAGLRPHPGLHRLSGAADQLPSRSGTATWLWMHNGLLAGFPTMKRDLAMAVDPVLCSRRSRGPPTRRCCSTWHSPSGSRTTRRPRSPAPSAWWRRPRVGTGSTDPVQMTVATTDGDTTWAFRYSSARQSRSLFHSTDMSTLRHQYPDNPVLHDLSDDARLVVSEPLGDLQGAWREVPESSYVAVHGAREDLRPFEPVAP